MHWGNLPPSAGPGLPLSVGSPAAPTLLAEGDTTAPTATLGPWAPVEETARGSRRLSCSGQTHGLGPEANLQVAPNLRATSEDTLKGTRRPSYQTPGTNIWNRRLGDRPHQGPSLLKSRR